MQVVEDKRVRCPENGATFFVQLTANAQQRQGQLVKLFVECPSFSFCSRLLEAFLVTVMLNVMRGLVGRGYLIMCEWSQRVDIADMGHHQGCVLLNPGYFGCVNSSSLLTYSSISRGFQRPGTVPFLFECTHFPPSTSIRIFSRISPGRFSRGDVL